MRKEEQQVLHGLYFERERIDDSDSYLNAEIYWLMSTPIPKTRSWRDGSKRHSLEASGKGNVEVAAATNAAARRVISFLNGAGLVSVVSDGNPLKISVTYEGAVIARELDSRIGRLNFLYRQYKDGVLWFFATVAVSATTSLLLR